jgi:hypothetical protein
MRSQGRILSGETSIAAFYVFGGSLVLGKCRRQSVSIAIRAWKGDGCMKDTDHLYRHGSRHPEGDTKCLEAWRLRVARHSVWTRAKH